MKPKKKTKKVNEDKMQYPDHKLDRPKQGYKTANMTSGKARKYETKRGG